MRRRRKTKYYWLPTVGTSLEGDVNSTTQHFALDIAPETIVSGVIPVIQNQRITESQEPSAVLNDLIGNEYILKRIVGKCFCAITATTTDATSPTALDAIPAVICTAGFFVARVELDTPGSGLPQGGLATLTENYAPLNNALQREPWIWRRSWILGLGTCPPQYVVNPNDVGNEQALRRATIQTGGDPYAATISPTYPQGNHEYPGVLDGPHVDAKTGRRVRQDEALFFAAAAHYIPYTTLGVADTTVSVDFTLDVRCLGALRRARNRSNF